MLNVASIIWKHSLKKLFDVAIAPFRSQQFIQQLIATAGTAPLELLFEWRNFSRPAAILRIVLLAYASWTVLDSAQSFLRSQFAGER